MNMKSRSQGLLNVKLESNDFPFWELVVMVNKFTNHFNMRRVEKTTSSD